MDLVLVSECLLGGRVRYDGSAAPSGHPVLAQWRREDRVVPFCPEVAAGLGIPRPPTELSQGRAVTRDGRDVTAAFENGAQAALELCLRLGIHVAVLKERSPSCGSSQICDGTFACALAPGEGLTTALLRCHGIAVFSEEQWEQAAACLERFTIDPSCGRSRNIE